MRRFRGSHLIQLVAAALCCVLAAGVLYFRLTADTCRRIAEGSPAPTLGEVAGVDVTEPETSPQPLFAEDFELFEPGARWRQKAVCGSLRVEYHGYGYVGTDLGSSTVHVQRPKSAGSRDDTHASMVTSTTRFRDFDLTLRTRTLDQVRKGKANPWEVSWIVWRYTDDWHFYYFIPKPNGWELGKRDPDYGGNQRILKTSDSPKFAVGPWYDVRVRHVGDTLTVWVDGNEIVSFADDERPYRRGAVGLYNEDALVHFDDIRVIAP